MMTNFAVYGLCKNEVQVRLLGGTVLVVVPSTLNIPQGQRVPDVEIHSALLEAERFLNAAIYGVRRGLREQARPFDKFGNDITTTKIAAGDDACPPTPRIRPKL